MKNLNKKDVVKIKGSEKRFTVVSIYPKKREVIVREVNPAPTVIPFYEAVPYGKVINVNQEHPTTGER